MTAILAITGPNDQAELDIQRSDSVPELFWSRLLAEWGSHGPDPVRHVRVRLERMLSQLDWLLPACRWNQVGIDWGDDAKALVTRAFREQAARKALADQAAALSPDEVRARLKDSRFSRELKDFQLRDLGRMLAMDNGANFSVPGAGKTTVAYALYEAERIAGRLDRLLVVAPLSAFDAWTDEAPACFSSPPKVVRLGRGAPSRRAEVVLVTYQRLPGAYPALSAWARAGKTHVVLDEAHRIKRGWQGEWGRTSLNLAYNAARRDVLSGTPAPQGFRDLEALFDFAWPGQSRRILPAEIFERAPPPDTGSQVAKAIAPYFVRTTKSDLDLTPPVKSVITVPLEGLQRDIYLALRDQYAGQLHMSRRSRADFAKMGEVVMYLLEAASNPALLPIGASDDDDLSFRHPPLAIPPGSTLADLIPRYAAYETPRKFIELGKAVKENADAGRKTLIWTNFVRNIATIENMLGRYEPAVIHGGVPSSPDKPGRTRESELARFRDKASACKVLIANPAAMSEGISLHRDCHEAIYVDRTFNAGQYLQSVDRIHRLGMDRNVVARIRYLVTEGTVDEVVDRRIAEKADRLGEILSDGAVRAMSLPDEDDYGRAIDTNEDLVSLFTHLRGGTP